MDTQPVPPAHPGGPGLCPGVNGAWGWPLGAGFRPTGVGQGATGSARGAPHHINVPDGSRISAFVLALICFYLTTPQADGFFDAVDRYVASLNSPAVQEALGLKEVRRSERSANRLEVTFESDLPPVTRSQILQQIGREFLQLLFRHQLIPVVVIVERNAAGRIVGSIIVSVSGRPVVDPEALPVPGGLC